MNKEEIYKEDREKKKYLLKRKDFEDVNAFVLPDRC